MLLLTSITNGLILVNVQDAWQMIAVGLIIIGFFSGFYMVPLYTLLQHRAPKERKGDIMATSNFVNVVGAMAASLLFFFLVQLGRLSGITPPVEQTDRVAEGVIRKIDKDEKTRSPVRVVIKSSNVNAPTVRNAIAALERRALATGQIEKPITVDTNRSGTVANITMPIKGTGTDAASMNALALLRFAA